MVTRKKKRTASKSHGPRASWKGTLSFGLVSMSVEAFNAIDREQGDIHFHQLHAKCHRRINYQKVCPVHGEVPNDEIVSGYEYQKDTYVEVDPDELDALRTEAAHTFKVDSFVEPGAVDPLYFDGRMYYLMPADQASAEPYSVFVTAMQREERYGVGQIILSGKNQVALLRTYEDVLHMALLNYASEIRPPNKVAKTPEVPKGAGRQVNLAQNLIREWSQDRFHFESYEDDYRQELAKLIKAKVAGKEIVKPQAEESRPQVISLMEALKQSLRQTTAPKTNMKRKGPTKKRNRSA
jgi:DNA end-binding protein Ku